MADDKPSAPPEEIGDFEWIADSMKNVNVNNNDNTNNNNVYPVLDKPAEQIPAPKQQQFKSETQGFEQPSDMAIPDAITQQVIYQKIMEENKRKKEESVKKSFIEQKNEYVPPTDNKNISQQQQPSNSYMAQDVQYPETSLYKAAGICIWRPKSNGKGIQFMMGLEKTNNSLSWFGGKKDNNDKSAVDTALREFHEETGKKLDDETLQQMRRMLISDKDRHVFWKKAWYSYLFFYCMSYDYDIVSNYSKNKSFNAEMKSLHWIDFEKIYNSICITGNLCKIGKHKNDKYPLRSFVVGMFLHKDVREYLFKLHIKNGGDINGIKPRKGGTMRQCITTSFINIPKIIRLSVINPITNNLLYYRWIEMELSDIEDYTLLTSLITSICAEIGRNFQIYYTNNEPFKTSKSQYVIDTIPAFNKLKKHIADKKKHYITQLIISPTFILSDNFKGISLSFKQKDLSYKKINPVDDEKGLMSSIYNKASDIAQSWFGGNNDGKNDDDDNKQEVNNNYNNNQNYFGGGLYFDNDDDDISWKWQFQNDSNKFEDCTKKSSRLIETAFMNGCSFAGYKKNGVPYNANFTKMIQKNLNTQKIRAIRRVPVGVKSEKEQKPVIKAQPLWNNNYFYQSPALKYYKWQYQDDDGTWKDYDVSISKQLNSFKVSWDNNINNYHYTYYRSKKRFDSHFTKTVTIKSNNGQSYTYLIDIKHFKQQNMTSKKERNVRQIPCYNHNYNNNLLFLPHYMNNNNVQLKYKWQFKDDGYENWKDYEKSISIQIEQQFTLNPYSNFNVSIPSLNYKSYTIYLNRMKQQSVNNLKYRSIRRVPMYEQFGGGIKNKWEWKDDDTKWKPYNNIISKQIESACNSGIKKYFFVSNKNNNSYEINFNNMQQYNVQTGKQRSVRKVPLKPKWKGMGPNPEKYKGPTNIHRKTFNKKIVELYCVIGDLHNTELQKSGKFIRGTLGPFGSGLYWYNSIKLAKEMAKNKNKSNKGNLIKAKIFIGKEKDVSNMNDKQYDFITLQKSGFDSVSRYVGIGKEHIVYNYDQVCIIKQEKYYG